MPKSDHVNDRCIEQAARQDIVYFAPADAPHEGLPLGNGSLGAMVWMPTEGYEFIINHTDLYDDQPDGHFDGWAADEEEAWTSHRSAGTIKITTDVPVHDRFYLSDFEARLKLDYAQLHCRSTSPLINASCKTWILQDPQVGVIHYQDQTKEPLGRRVNLARFGSRVFTHWYRQIKREPSMGLDGTQTGDDAWCFWVHQRLRDMDFVFAVRVEGTAGSIRREHSRSVTYHTAPALETDLTVYYTVVNSEQADNPLHEARRRLQIASHSGRDTLDREHRLSWRHFWSKSYVQLSDTYLENLWYVTLYLLASSSRGKYPANFIDGLWSLNRDFRAWGHFYHWNQQSMYWFLGPAGHSELERSHLDWRRRTLRQARDYARMRGVANGAFYTDIANRRGWQDKRDCVAHNRTPGLQLTLDFWRYFQYTNDLEYLRDYAWPVMLEAATFQLGFMERGEDGQLHTAISTPYEDDSAYFLTRDCITDLAMIRAAFAALIQAASQLGYDDEARPFAKALEDLVDFTLIDLPDIYFKQGDGELVFSRDWPDLPDYPIRPPFGPVGLGDAEKVGCTRGFSIGFLEPEGGRPFTWKDATRPKEGKYLFRGVQECPVFPAGLIGLKDRRTERFEAMISTAKGNWTPSHGHCILPVVYARLGLKQHLGKYLSDVPSLYQHCPQGLFTYACKGAHHDALNGTEPYVTSDASQLEQGAKYPMRRDSFVHFGFDAAGTFCSALTEMLVQSYDGVIRVFPALPDEWSGRFRLRATGGFWIEASAVHGQAVELAVTSDRGGVCRIDCHDICTRLDSGAPRVETDPGCPVAIALSDDAIMSFETDPGIRYTVVFSERPDFEADLWPPESAGIKRHGDAYLGKERDF